MQAELLRIGSERAHAPRSPSATSIRTLVRVAQTLASSQRVPLVLRHVLGRIAGSRSTCEVRWPIDAQSDQRDAVLLVSHDLSRSGAPKVLLEITSALTAGGFRVVVAAPLDGPCSPLFIAAGATVVLDARLIHSGNATLATLGAAAVAAICNTLVTHEAVRQLSAVIPTFWYLHEVSMVESLIRSKEVAAADFRMPFQLWCGSEQSAALVRSGRPDVRVVPYGLVALRHTSDPQPLDDGHDPVRFAVFGSCEMRKGQDLAVEAVRLLAPAERAAMRLTLFGRSLDPGFDAKVREAARGLPVTFGGELDAQAYRAAMLDTDVVLVSSRDDTLPLVSLDALGAQCILACTPTTGTAAYLRDGIDGFVSDATTAEGLARLLSRVLATRSGWPAIRANGVRVFEREFSQERFAGVVIDGVQQAMQSRHPSAR